MRGVTLFPESAVSEFSLPSATHVIKFPPLRACFRVGQRSHKHAHSGDEETFSINVGDVGMAVPKTTESRCRD